MKTIRVLWLLNHTTLRKFEIDQLHSSGVAEIFLPKSFPFDEGNLSASVVFTEDESLTIPRQDLEVLNAQDWYSNPSDEAWAIANRYFDVAVIGFFPLQIDAAVRHFQGAVVLRVFGLSKGYSYSRLMYEECGEKTVRNIKKMGSRFWFGVDYEHLKDEEEHFLASRDCYLPVGLKGEAAIEEWQGQVKKILFVCPRIGTSPYFEQIYKDFTKAFSGFDYSIGGAQPVKVADDNVLGFVTADEHAFNMRQHRLMFYHSTEPNHIHYHPFEAIRLGMPLLYMAGGMLDLLGGKDLPGRCMTLSEARSKAQRIMDGDNALIESIRSSQMCLLEPMKASRCEKPWREGFSKVLMGLEQARQNPSPVRKVSKRIAVIVPVEYRGGSLRGAKLVAQALKEGAQQAGESIEVVLLHLDNPAVYDSEEFDDLANEIAVRPFRWKYLDSGAARRAMIYAGHEAWVPATDQYKVVDDGINALQDCDIWVVISDRLDVPLLPMKPIVLMVYDYLQRYVQILPHGADQPYLEAARSADRVMVTTEFTRSDALQYAGVDPRRLVKVPMLSPDFSRHQNNASEQRDYFIWTTNAAKHKNHENALKALKFYYEELDGQLSCHVTGVDTKRLLKGSTAHLKQLAAIVKQSPALKKKLKFIGELPDRNYRYALANAAYLWHAGAIDNGTFSVVEAAGLGVPALSSDYPAMREIDKQFSLNLNWMRPLDPKHMAAQLKEMEMTYSVRRAALPTSEVLREQSMERLAGAYWQVIEACL